MQYIESLVYFLLFILVCSSSKKKYSSLFNIQTIFTGIWTIFGIIAAFGVYGYRQPVLIVHFYAWCFLIITNVVISKYSFKTNIPEIEVRVKTPLVILTQVATVGLMAPKLAQSIAIFMVTGSLSDVRREFFFNKGDGYNNYVLDLLFGTIPYGLCFALIVYFAYLTFSRKKSYYLLFALFNSVLMMIANGGRDGMFMILTISLVILSYSHIYQKHNNSYTSSLKKVIIIAGVFLVGISLMRGTTSLSQSIVAYFSGSLSFFDYILAHPRDYDMDGGYLYGYMIFGFITEPIVILLKVLGVTEMKIPSYYFNEYCQKFVDISSASSPVPLELNNNTSVLFFFIRDSGFIGLIVGSLFYGFLVTYSLKKWSKGDHFWGAFHIYVCQTLMMSIMGYSLQGYSLVFTLIILRLLLPKNKKYARKIDICDSPGIQRGTVS